MQEIIKFISREVPSKILLILFVYKDGKVGDKFLGPLTMTKLLYPNNPLFVGSVIENINKLEEFGIIYSKRERIKNRNRRILFINFKKFVEIFDYYYNLGLTEEEKEILAKWFSEVDWKFLIDGCFEEIIRGELNKSIIKIIGDLIKSSLLVADLFKINKYETNEKNDYIEFNNKLLALPNPIIEKLNKIKFSSPLLEKLILLIVISIYIILQQKIK